MAIDRTFKMCRESFPPNPKKINPIVRMEYYEYRTDIIAKDLLVLQMRGLNNRRIIFFKTDKKGTITNVMSVKKSVEGYTNPKRFYPIDWKKIENIVFVAEHWQQKSATQAAT